VRASQFWLARKKSAAAKKFISKVSEKIADEQKSAAVINLSLK